MSGCRYCNDGHDIGDSCSVTIRHKHLNISYSAYSTDSDFDDEIPINYCPMCGTMLREGDEEISLE